MKRFLAILLGSLYEDRVKPQSFFCPVHIHTCPCRTGNGSAQNSLCNHAPAPYIECGITLEGR